MNCQNTNYLPLEVVCWRPLSLEAECLKQQQPKSPSHTNCKLVQMHNLNILTNLHKLHVLKLQQIANLNTNQELNFQQILLIQIFSGPFILKKYTFPTKKALSKDFQNLDNINICNCVIWLKVFICLHLEDEARGRGGGEGLGMIIISRNPPLAPGVLPPNLHFWFTCYIIGQHCNSKVGYCCFIGLLHKTNCSRASVRFFDNARLLWAFKSSCFTD